MFPKPEICLNHYIRELLIMNYLFFFFSSEEDAKGVEIEFRPNCGCTLLQINKRNAELTMHSPNRRTDECPNGTNIKLPQLPPLNTKKPFTDNALQHKDRITIGWTPINEPQTPPQVPFRFEHTATSQNPLGPLSPNRNRRPPPPPVSCDITTTSASPSNIGSPLSITPTISTLNKPPQTSSRIPSIYRSPFVGEDDILSSQEQPISTPSKIYKSPFVGDPSDILVKERKSSVIEPSTFTLSQESSPQSYNATIFSRAEPLPNVTYDNNSETLDESMRTMKSLPALPPLAKPEVRNGSSPFADLPPQISRSDADNFYKPPPPLNASQSRHTSDGRKFSDSISSYYASSNYTFNNTGELRQSSFNSILGGKPLQQIPSVTAPTQPFSIDLLDENKLYQCYSVTLLSDIYEWLLKVYFEWFNEYVFEKFEFFQMVQLLLEFQLPNSCDQDVIDSSVDKIIESLALQSAIRFEYDDGGNSSEEITIIVAGLDVQGVFTDLLPCYSHSKKQYHEEGLYCCYSARCGTRLLKEVRPELKLSEIINKSVGLWTDYWKLTPEDLSDISPREIKRQSFIFDLIILEQRSLNLANAAIEIYGSNFDPSFLPLDPNFASMAFDVFIPLIELHKEYLLSPIFWKLKTRGKFIDGVGKIYLKWCSEAHNTYLQYADAMATVHEIISWEKEHNTKFGSWLKQIDNSPEVTRSKLYHDVIFFGGFFKSLQNMPVTLQSILKNTDPSMEDYEYLKLAISEIENLNSTVNQVHGIAVDHRRVIRFSRQLVIGTGGSNTIGYANITNDSISDLDRQEKLDLKLTEKSRKMVKSGTVFKKRDLWLEATSVHIVLLDNYFLITEAVVRGSDRKYKLSERPIPIDYLSLETKEGLKISQIMTTNSSDGVSQTFVKQSQVYDPLPSTPISSVKPHLINAASTVTSIPKTLYYSAANTSSDDDSSDPNDATFPFKIRNTATNESFTFLTTSLEDRDTWVAAIIACFKQYSNKNDRQIFKLKCLSDMFSYDERQAPTNLPVTPEGSVLGMALKQFYQDNAGSKITVNADVYCAVQFTYESKRFILCGTNYGIYIASFDYICGWKRILNMTKVSRMEVNTKLGLLFVLADRRLCHFNLPSIICGYYDSQKYLDGNQIVGVMIREKVTFFKMAEDFSNSRHLFYERKGKIFVMTPEFDRITKAFKFFKVYKEYKLPSTNNGLLTPEVQDIAVFKRSFIVSSSKGALLYNESFNDMGIVLPSFLNDKPVLSYHHHHLSHHPFKTTMESSSKKDSSKQKMAEYVKTDIVTNKTKPVGCFQISNDDFILVYDEAVVKLNNNGEIPDWKEDILVLDFYCLSASMNNEFLILVGENLIQIYDFNYMGNIVNNKLNRLTPVQIIKGKKLELISCQKQDDTVVVLSHPTIPGRQLIVGFYPAE